MRGKITKQITDEAKALLGINEITTSELRLMPYLQYSVINNLNIDPNKINHVERAILSTWRKRGWIVGGASDLRITEKFWKAINRLIWLGYVRGGGSSHE